MYGVFSWCFNISQGTKIIIEAFRVYKGGASISHRVKKIIIDAYTVYWDGASISHRVRRSFSTRLGCIWVLLKYLAG